MAGTYKADSDETNVRTNLIFATAATLLPHIYAKNPEISVSPSESVDDSEYEMIRQLCKASANRGQQAARRRGEVKARVKSGIRSTMTTSVGWFKLSYQQSLTAGDPMILRRAQRRAGKPAPGRVADSFGRRTTDRPSSTSKARGIKQQLQGIMSGAEVKIFKGFTLDRVKTEDMFILDESITEFDEYVDAKKIAHRVWMTDDEFEATSASSARRARRSTASRRRPKRRTSRDRRSRTAVMSPACVTAQFSKCGTRRPIWSRPYARAAKAIAAIRTR
jgi:hypothetical protein